MARPLGICLIIASYWPGWGGAERQCRLLARELHRHDHEVVILTRRRPDGPSADQVDGVICTGVLEHVNDAEAMIYEIWRVLRPGGLAYFAVPFIQGYHPGTGTHQDFRRLTHIGLQQLLSAFERLDFGVSGGPSASLAWILREYLALLFFDGGRGYSLAYMVAGWVTCWMPALDCVLSRRDKAHRIACGFYLLGRKP